MTSELMAGLNPSTIIERQWEGIPGTVLCFPVSISMSSAAATNRDASIALTDQERTERLLDFRMRMVADVLESAPTLVRLASLDKALEAKQEEAIGRLTVSGKERDEKVDRIRERVRLTKEEIDSLREPFPGFPTSTPETLATIAYEYFTQDDARGNKVFQLLIEEVMAEYWLWASPRPTFSVSAYMQSK